jgi:hypothetical protein
MTGIFTPAYSVSKRTGSDGPASVLHVPARLGAQVVVSYGREWPIPGYIATWPVALTWPVRPPATLSSQLIPCHLPRSTTHSRAANGRAARVSQRSARVCPPGSSQGAGAAQGLWGPSTTGRGQDHLDSVLGVGLPGGMDGHRPSALPGPDPVADHLVTQQQRGRSATSVGGPGALDDQWAGGHSDRGQPKHGAKVEGKAGAAGMVAAGGIDHQHLGDDRQGTHGLLEQRAFAEGEQGRPVRPTGGPADAHPGQRAAAGDDRCPGESSVTGGAGPVDSFEADEAGAEPQPGRRRGQCSGSSPPGSAAAE